MKILVIPPYFSYDSVASGENPYEETRYIDASTPEFELAAKRLVFLNMDEWEFEEVFPWPRKPQQPKLSLNDANNPEKVAQLASKFEEESRVYNERTESFSSICKTFEEGGVEALSSEQVEEAWKHFYARRGGDDDGGFSGVYLVEVESPLPLTEE